MTKGLQATILSSLALTLNLHAAVSFWDANGSVAGAGATPAGTWGVNTYWSADTNGALPTTAWISGNTAIFSAGDDATNAFTVAVAGGQLVAGIVFEEGTATLSGGSLLPSASPFLVAVNSNATINSTIIGTRPLTKTGLGTLRLTGTNTYTGLTTIREGVVAISNPSALGGTATGTIISNDATLEITGGITLNEPLNIFGRGMNNDGAVRSMSGSNWIGAIQMDTAMSQKSLIYTASGMLTLGRVDAGGKFTLITSGPGQTVISGENPSHGLNWPGAGGGIIVRDNATLRINGLVNLRGIIFVEPQTTLRMGNHHRFGNSGNAYPSMVLDGVFDLNGFTNTIDGLSGYGSIINNGSSTLVMGVGASGQVYPIFHGVIRGDTTVVKEGSAIQGFVGHNTYTGDTFVNAGILNVYSGGSMSNSPVIHVAAGATLFAYLSDLVIGPSQTLTGDGLLEGPVIIAAGGRIQPGNSAGTLTLSRYSYTDLDLSAGGILDWDLAALSVTGPGTNFDSILNAGQGTVTLGGASKLRLHFIGSATAPDFSNPFWQEPRTWNIIASTNTVSNFAVIENGTFPAGNFITSVTTNGVLLTFFPRICATNLMVTTTHDSGPGSLRQALLDANECPGKAIIEFAPSAYGTITLTNGELLITGDVDILGPGPANVAINGNHASRVFHISPSNEVTITGLTVSNGYAFTASGGGIFNDHATLTLSNCTVTGNSALDFGAGIFNDGVGGRAGLRIVNSTLSSNSAYLGGGVFNDGRSFGSASVEMINCTSRGNSASGAFGGGGVFNDGYSGRAALRIVNCTFSGNTAGHDGDGGGGISNYAPYSGSDATLEIGSTVLSAGASGENILNVFGVVTSLGYNLSSDGGGGVLTNLTDQINTDPMLGAFQDNGGPTFTHALLCGSPAIDKGKNFSGSVTDQRSVGFVRTFDDPNVPGANGGDGTDIGAFEQQVICNRPPVFMVCPGDFSTTNDAGECSALLSFTVSAGGTPTPTVECRLGTNIIESPHDFPVGTNVVTCTASNSAGTNTCVFTVTVADITPPAITCSSNITIQATSSNGAVVTYTSGAADACGLRTFDCTPPSGSTFPVGTTTVTCRAIDSAGNSNSCSFTVTVTPPNQCPSAVLSVSPTAPFTNRSETIVIATDNWQACVVLDGSASSDPETNALTYTWLTDGFNVFLDPVQEPGGGGTGSGSGTVAISGNTLTLNVAFSGMTANATAAHIHGPAGIGTNAGVLYPLNSITTLGVTAGSISGTVTLAEGTGGFTMTQQLQQLLAGLWYINIHSSFRPGGEIRGQILGATQSGAVVTNCLSLGTHEICLTVNDGKCSDTTCLTVEVISPCQSIGLLIENIENSSLARNKKRPLIASLRAACESFEEGKLNPGTNQLGAFQNKVRAQVGDAPLAESLIHDAQVIIDAVGGH